MAQQQKAVSQYPLPPKRYYEQPDAGPTPRPPPPAPPPPPAATATYHMFGGEYTVEDHLPTLEEAGRTRLYDPAAPPCQELLRLNARLLQRFQQLVKRLCQPLPLDAPDDPHKDAIEEIEDVFVNMQHLINVMRPAQAAIDLNALLSRQTNARKQMADRLQESVHKAWELIGEAAGKLAEDTPKVSEDAQQVTDPDPQKPQPNSTPPKDTAAPVTQDPQARVMADIANIVADTSM